MYRPMIPCPECERHVRVSERQCPFCGVALGLTAPALSRRDAMAWPRTAAWVIGTVVATASGGCAESVGAGRSDSGGSGEDVALRADATGVRDAAGGHDVPTVEDVWSGPDDSGGAAILYGPAPAPVVECPRHPEVSFPVAANRCNDASDCVAVEHGLDCCGTIQYVGVNRAAQAAQFDPSEAQCRTAVNFGACDCAARAPTTQSGQMVVSPDAIVLDCRFGACWTRLP